MNQFRDLILFSRRIISYLQPYRARWLFLFLISLSLSFLNLANPLILRFFIDHILLAKNFLLLKDLVIFFIGLTIFTSAVRLFTSYYYRKLELHILYDIRNQLFAHIEKLDLRFFSQKKLGDLLTRLDSDVDSIEEFISLLFNTLISNALHLTAILAVSFYLSWQFTLIALLVIPLYVIGQKYFAERLEKLFTILKRQSAFLTSFFEEKLSGILLVQLFGREEYELMREKTKVRDIIRNDLNVTLTSSLASALINFIAFSALLSIFWLGGYQVIGGTISLGTFLAIYTYLGAVFVPLQTLAGLYTSLQAPLASARRVFQILDTPPLIREKIDGLMLRGLRGEIRFDNVSFYYERESGYVLKNLNFVIQPGEIIGIAGASGSGKTTIAHLIARLYDPQSGTVSIDGHNIKELKLKSLRSALGYVSQQPILFNASIKENLTYGHPHAFRTKEIIEAAKRVKIYDFINDLPKKFDTKIGEDAMRLSGGEKQRCALARLILKHSSQIIILDEATSSLDYANEAWVMDNLLRIFAGKTFIIMSHRLETVKRAKKILVLKDGRIEQVGSFDELLKTSPEFIRLYSLQK